MSIALPNNKKEKRARYWMLWRQGSISWRTAIREYRRYCRMFKQSMLVLGVGVLIGVGGCGSAPLYYLAPAMAIAFSLTNISDVDPPVGQEGGVWFVDPNKPSE